METDNSLDFPTRIPPKREMKIPRDLAEHPRYAINRVLGIGGMGVVYQAQHRIMDRPVALKVIHPQALGNAQALERFRREVRAAAKLTHPNIVTAYDADQAGKHHFLVMEYVEGTTLSRLVERKGRLPVVLACQAIRQAALGLQHAFEQGMVHRDVKPQNLLMDRTGQVKIMDFGLARIALGTDGEEVGRLTTVGSMLGTPDYIAPEQANDSRNVDIRADLYSLGCSLYFLLAGRPPFPDGTPVSKMMSHLELEPTPLAELRPNLPVGLIEIVAKMMAKRPGDRYQTPAEVAEALLPFTVKASSQAAHDGVAELAIAIEPPSVREEPRSFSRMMQNPKRRALVSTCLGMVVVATVGVVAERSSHSHPTGPPKNLAAPPQESLPPPPRVAEAKPAPDAPEKDPIEDLLPPPGKVAKAIRSILPPPPGLRKPARPRAEAAKPRTIGLLVAPSNYDQGELDLAIESIQNAGATPVLISSSSVDPEEVRKARDAGLSVQNLDSAGPETYDAVIVIGGTGVREYLDNGASGENAQGLLKELAGAGKPVGSVGLGAGVLADAHLLEGRKVAAPPVLEYMLKVKKGRPVDDGFASESGVLTARGRGDLPRLVNALTDGLAP